MITSIVLDLLFGVIVADGLFMLASFVKKSSVDKVLDRDIWGWVFLVPGLLAVVLGAVLPKGDFTPFAIYMGSLTFGIGFLVAAPNGLNERLLNPRNIGIAIACYGLYILGAYVFAPLVGPWNIMMNAVGVAFSSWWMIVSSAVGSFFRSFDDQKELNLIVGFVLISFGIIFFLILPSARDAARSVFHK